MEIPWRSLSDDALRGVIQDYVLREGTEYGTTDVLLDTKVAQVMAQIREGKVGVFFDRESATATLRTLEND